MQEMLTENSSTMQLLMDSIMTNRFDLAMFAIGLVAYIVLNSIRRSREAKGFHKKLDITFDSSEVSEVIDEVSEFEVIDANQATVAASDQLSEGLGTLEHCDTDVTYATAGLKGFLRSHPTYEFTLREVETTLVPTGCLKADKAVGEVLLEHMQPLQDGPILSSFIRFYADTKQSEKACDLFEWNYDTFFDFELDEHVAWKLLMAALKCGRQSLAEHLLATSDSDIGKQVEVLQRWWRRKAAKMGESRVAHMGEVLNRLSNVFNERFPFEEQDHSDDESTAFLGDDSDCEVDDLWSQVDMSSDGDSEASWDDDDQQL